MVYDRKPLELFAGLNYSTTVYGVYGVYAVSLFEQVKR
jgi:hypothetical protein